MNREIFKLLLTTLFTLEAEKNERQFKDLASSQNLFVP